MSETPDPHDGDRSDAAKSQQQALYVMAGAGGEFVAAVLLFVAVGWWIDRKTGYSPAFILVGVALGFVIGLRSLLRAGGKLSRKKR